MSINDYLDSIIDNVRARFEHVPDATRRDRLVRDYLVTNYRGSKLLALTRRIGGHYEYALNHAKRLQEAGLELDEIKRVLVCMTTARERRAIIKSLTDDAVSA